MGATEFAVVSDYRWQQEQQEQQEFFLNQTEHKTMSESKQTFKEVLEETTKEAAHELNKKNVAEFGKMATKIGTMMLMLKALNIQCIEVAERHSDDDGAATFPQRFDKFVDMVIDVTTELAGHDTMHKSMAVAMRVSDAINNEVRNTEAAMEKADAALNAMKQHGG